jgi:hypothetical protein
MLFSALGISITMLTLLVTNPQKAISQSISFSVGNMNFFIYVCSILIFFHNGSSVFVSFSAVFADRYFLLCCVFIGFHPYSDGKTQVKY